jgi:hypothetical protein
MKRSIHWHERVIAASRADLKKDMSKLDDEQRRILRLQARLTAWQMQIDEAKKRGLEEFDMENFLKSQVKRVMTQASPDAAEGGSTQENK